MTMLRWKAVSPIISTGTSVKTLLQVVGATNVPAALEEWSISFQGTSNTATPIQVDVVTQSTAGTMTALTLNKDPSDAGETLQTTAQQGASAEPTLGVILFTENVHPQTGYTWQAPFGRSMKLIGGGRIGIRVTAAASVNAVCRINGEE